jgi:endonuclease/exonuclease/phosphatase family metal-dependent hydrolase
MRSYHLLSTVLAVAILGVAALPARAEPLACLREVSGVTWIRSNDRQEILDRWCESVGPPIFAQGAEREGAISRLLVVSWNVHVGGADLEELMAKTLEPLAARRDTGVVILMQEAFRSGADVPESLPRDLDVPSAIRPRRPSADVVAIARRFGMSVAYVPSMRNGSATALEDREDRGNAILSTEPLSDVRAIELPFGKQRRVAVAATVTPRGSTIAPMRVVTTHFDTNGDRVDQADALAERIDTLADLPVILAGDLNARRGFGDRSVTAMSRRLALESCGTRRTSRWPWRLDIPLFFLIGRVDFMFSTLESSVARNCRTLSHAYDSDHLPILLDLSAHQ